MTKKIVVLCAVTVLVSAIAIDEIYATSLTGTNDYSSKASSPESPLSPMQMLVAHSQHIAMGYVYSFTVRVFDPKLNPDKNILQNHGQIPNVNVNATIFEKNGQVYKRFSGITDKQGTYSESIFIPITSDPQKEFYTVFKASKQGYVSQSAILPFVAFHPGD